MARKKSLIPIIGCLVVMFGIGITYLWSFFQQPVIDHYAWASPEAASTSAAMISSLMIFMFIFGSMIGGFIQDKTSPRFVMLVGGALIFIGLFSTSLLGREYPWLIYITYSVCAGCGVGFAYSGSLNCIQKWFPHRRGFASGLSVCAFGLSVFAFGPLIKWLLSLPAFGDNAVPLTFRTLAFVFTAIVVIAGSFVRNPNEEYLKSLNLPSKVTNQKQFKPSETIKTPAFWCLCSVIFLLPASYFIVQPFFGTLSKFRDVSPELASFTIYMVGIAQAISRLVSGFVSDKIGRARSVFILGVIACGSILLMTFARGWLYTIAVWLIAFAYGGPSSIYPAMSTDAYGTKHSGGNYGMALMFLGISSPVFTMIAGRLSPNGAETGDYTLSFIVGAAVCIIPFIALPLFEIFRKRMQNAQNKG